LAGAAVRPCAAEEAKKEASPLDKKRGGRVRLAHRRRRVAREVNRGFPAPMLIKYFTRVGLDWQLKDGIRRK
jgi:hypothetical protein